MAHSSSAGASNAGAPRRPLSPAVAASLGAPGFAPPSAFGQAGGRAQVLLVDSDADCLRRFAKAVSADAGLQLLPVAHDSDTAMQCLAQHRPQVLIVEPGLARGFGMALIRHCAIRLPQAQILVRSQVGDDERVLAAIEAGASGQVYKDADAGWIVACIHMVRDGGALISPGVARRVLARFGIRAVVGSGEGGPSGFGELAASAGGPQAPLSGDEIDILRLVACGTALHDIGEELALPPPAVLAQVKAIYRKVTALARR